MAYKTMSQLVQHVILRLRMQRGTAVQTYAEDLIAAIILEKFLDAANSRLWSHLTDRHKFTLDGVSGHLVEKVSDYFEDFTDIYACRINNRLYTAAQLQPSIIPEEIYGNLARYMVPSKLPEKIVQFIPLTSSGDIWIVYQNYKKEFLPNDEVPFDENYLVYSACADYLSSDGETSEVTKYLQLADKRLKTLIGNENKGVTRFDGRWANHDFISEWGW